MAKSTRHTEASMVEQGMLCQGTGGGRKNVPRIKRCRATACKAGLGCIRKRKLNNESRTRTPHDAHKRNRRNTASYWCVGLQHWSNRRACSRGGKMDWTAEEATMLPRPRASTSSCEGVYENHQQLGPRHIGLLSDQLLQCLAGLMWICSWQRRTATADPSCCFGLSTAHTPN